VLAVSQAIAVYGNERLTLFTVPTFCSSEVLAPGDIVIDPQHGCTKADNSQNDLCHEQGNSETSGYQCAID
jgi:hypothetical protein